MTSLKPFLRWAGGKTWLLKHIEKFLPNEKYNIYHEPFLGGGAIFFYLQPEKAILSDLNPDLIETYIAIRDKVEDVIDELNKFKNTSECYYEVRSMKYRSTQKRAAQFIFLNQTSFNGIYRVNLNGDYNVPYGFRKKDFLEPELLRSASTALKDTIIKQANFKDTLMDISSGDLVFLDPPYTVTHYNNGFIKYNEKLFDLDAQYGLSEYIDQIKEKGAYYILTNAAHEKIKEIFKKEGDIIVDISRASLVGGKEAKRGRYSESVFSNIQDY